MEQSALSIDDGSAAPLVAPPIQAMEAVNIIAYPSAVAPARIVAMRPQEHRTRRRREKFRRFIRREAAALFFLVFFLAGVHNRSIVELGLSSAFFAGIVVACLAAVGIPVLFYGLPRQKYGYRRRVRRY
jgi:hypothetical protein